MYYLLKLMMNDESEEELQVYIVGVAGRTLETLKKNALKDQLITDEELKDCDDLEKDFFIVNAKNRKSAEEQFINYLYDDISPDLEEAEKLELIELLLYGEKA